jgi:hypothetical protein
MIDISFSDIDLIYNYSNQIKIRYHLVQHCKFEQFCYALQNFKRILNEYLEDDYWKEFLYPLMRYQFELSRSA